MPPPAVTPAHSGSNSAAAGADISSAALTEPTSPAAPLGAQPSAAAATSCERGPPGVLVKAAAERSKRPQQMAQQPAQQRPQRHVKRMRSQQLLGSTASQQVSNVGGLGASARARARSASPTKSRSLYPVNNLLEGSNQRQLQTGRPQSQGSQRCVSASTHPPLTDSFSNSCGQTAPWQEDASGGSAAPTDVYSSLAPAADMQGQQRQRQDSSVAACGCASEWVDEFMLDPVHEQLQEAADGWLFSDLGLPDSPSLDDLLLSCAPEDADKPQEHQLPDSITSVQQQPQQIIPLPAQHGNAQLAAVDSPILADLLMTGPPAEAPEPSWMELPGSAVLTAQHEPAQPSPAAAGAEAHAAAQHAGAQAGVYGADVVFTPACSEAAAAPMQAGGAGYLLAPMLSDEALAQSLQQVLAAGRRASPTSGHSSGSMLPLDGSLPMHSPQGQHTAQVQGSGLQQQQHQMQCGQWSWAPAAAPAADASLQGVGSQAVAACAGREAAGMVQGAGLAPAAAAEDRPPVGVQGLQIAVLAHSPGPAYAGAAPFMAAGSSHSSCCNMQALLPAAAAAAGHDELEDMLMSVLTRAGQQAAARAPPSRRPMQRHASTDDLLLGGHRDADRLLRQQQQFYQPLPQELQPLAGAPPAGERLQGQLSAPDYGFKPALSEGCLVTDLAGRPPGVHSMAGSVSAGSPWVPTGPGYPQTAHGSISSSSASSMVGGYREQRQALGQGIYSLRRVSAPAAAARSGTRVSPFQSMQAAAALQDVPDAPVSPETATLLHFVADLLRSSDSRIADIVRQQIVPAVTAAAAQGVEMRPVLKRLWLTLVDANLQAQRAQLMAVLEVAPGASQDSLASKTQDLAAAMSLVMQLRNLVTGAAAAPSQLARFNSTGIAPEASTQTVAAMGGLRMMGSNGGGMGFDGFESVSGMAAAGLSASVPGSQQWMAHRQQSSVRDALPPDGIDWFEDRVVRAVMRQ